MDQLLNRLKKPWHMSDPTDTTIEQIRQLASLQRSNFERKLNTIIQICDLPADPQVKLDTIRVVCLNEQM